MTAVLMPKVGDMTAKVVMIEWHVSVGDRVAVGDVLATVETDKVEADLPAPVAGVVTHLAVAPDDEVAVGAGICEIEEQR
ncbi:MAG: hypothetical protein A3F77_11805 [Betaproteobacteria bacterium RIFCSPLOWO2_12_FULL_67_28]|nr:MAG: hypothetical protein A3F77_11805 [Betaproteobacteria bacterium RIFCSPLOWO2_12_FULL_67_28]